MGKINICPDCGARMIESDDPCYDVECPNCGAKGDIMFDDYEQQEYILLDSDENNNDIFSEPDCCRACGGPYPQCMTSCKIFDD